VTSAKKLKNVGQNILEEQLKQVELNLQQSGTKIIAH